MRSIKVWVAFLFDWLLTGGQASLPSNAPPDLKLVVPGPNPLDAEWEAMGRHFAAAPLPAVPLVASLEETEERGPRFVLPQKPRGPLSSLPKRPPEEANPCPATKGVKLGGLLVKPALADVPPIRLSDLVLSEDSPKVVYGTWAPDAVGPRMSYDGMPLHVTVDAALGTEGLPWSMGRLRLETHPDLAPVTARGLWGSPGVYHELQAVPPAANRLLEITTAITGSPWRLDDPAMVEADKERWTEQVAFQRSVWERWASPGQERSLRGWIEELIRTPLVYGFGLWECHMDFEGFPAVPAFRAPWTVDRWVLQGETPVGWVQAATTTDSNGRMARQVLIPWERTVHVAHRQTGPSDLEGRSLLRDAYTALRALVDLYQMQMLSAALNSVGTWSSKTALDANISDAALDEIALHLQSFESQHVPFILPPPGVEMVLHSPDAAVVDLSPQVALYERAAAVSMGGGHTFIALQGDGSRAARESASSDARDLYDYYAVMVSHGIEKAMRRYLRMKWPTGPLYTCSVLYGQVETQDNGAYMTTLSTYLNNVRPKLQPEAQALLDAQLDLPAAGGSSITTV